MLQSIRPAVLEHSKHVATFHAGAEMNDGVFATICEVRPTGYGIFFGAYVIAVAGSFALPGVAARLV